MYSVLIVEDEPMERDFLRSMMEREMSSDDMIYDCESGTQAVTMARKYSPDIIFMDIFLPELDGIGAIERIQKFLPDAIICILSASSDFEHARKAVNLHIFEYILKPMRPNEFRGFIHSVTDAVDEKRSRGKDIADVRGIQEKKQEPFIEESVKYIRKHFQEKLTLGDVSARVYMNPQYFSRVFKRETGLTFTHYINKLRIEYACKLLETTNYTAYRIAGECGFTDASYFNRVFYAQMNMSPKKYKRSTYSDRDEVPDDFDEEIEE